MCNTLQGLNFEDIILKKNVNWQSGDDDSSARNQKEARHPAPLAPALLLDPREYLIFFLNTILLSNWKNNSGQTCICPRDWTIAGMKENTEYLELFIIVDDTKFQQDQENLIFLLYS